MLCAAETSILPVGKELHAPFPLKNFTEGETGKGSGGREGERTHFFGRVHPCVQLPTYREASPRAAP